MEDLKFFFVCAMTFAWIVLLALLSERFLSRDRKKLFTTHYISYTAIFACMAGILMTLEIPLFFAPAFYKLDFSELPVLICTFYLGPTAGVVCELVKILVKLLIKGTSSAFVGELANFIVGCSFILPASVFYHSRPGKKAALVGMAVGTLVLTAFGSFFNAFYLIPKFAELYGMPPETIVAMGTKVNASITDVKTLVFFAVVPFNLLKGCAVSTVTFLLYKRISPILHKGDTKRFTRHGSDGNSSKEN